MQKSQIMTKYIKHIFAGYVAALFLLLKYEFI